MKEKLLALLNKRVTWTFKVWQWGLIAIAVALAALMSGCVTDHQKGGGATTEVEAGSTKMYPPTRPAAKPPENVKIEQVEPGAPPVIHQTITQPENPEGSSSMSSKQTTTTIHPDGTVVVNNTETETEIGGSQDYAAILKEYGKTDYFKSMIFSICLFAGAWLSWRREWPLVAACLAAGAIASLFVAWWAGALSVLICCGLYIGYKVALPIQPS